MSSTAHSNDCTHALNIKANEQAKCSGLLISHPQAKQCLTCKTVTVPSLESMIKGCNNKVKILEDLNEKLKKRANDAVQSSEIKHGTSTIVLISVSVFAAGFAAGSFALSVSK